MTLDEAPDAAKRADTMTSSEAHETLQCFAKESTTNVARAASLVLDGMKHLYQLLRDLVDFDVGEVPELDALNAAEGPRQIEQHNLAWQRAIAEVGARTPRRFVGDLAAAINANGKNNSHGKAYVATELWQHRQTLARLKAWAIHMEAHQDIDTTLGHVAEELRDLIAERRP